MLSIVFHDLSISDCFEHFIERDALLNHFLLGMLSDPYVVGTSLSAYLLQHTLSALYRPDSRHHGQPRLRRCPIHSSH